MHAIRSILGASFLMETVKRKSWTYHLTMAVLQFGEVAPGGQASFLKSCETVTAGLQACQCCISTKPVSTGDKQSPRMKARSTSPMHLIKETGIQQSPQIRYSLLTLYRY